MAWEAVEGNSCTWVILRVDDGRVEVAALALRCRSLEEELVIKQEHERYKGLNLPKRSSDVQEISKVGSP